MALFTPEGERAFGYLGVIEAAARVKASTADIWAAVRAEAQRVGVPTLGISFGDVTAIRSWAVRLRNADAAFAGASKSDSITANMVTTAIWSPQDHAGIATTPNYLARAQVTVQQPDGTVTTQWMSWNFADSPFGLDTTGSPYTVGTYTQQLTNVFSSRVQTAPEDTNTPTGTLLSVSSINLQVF